MSANGTVENAGTWAIAMSRFLEPGRNCEGHLASQTICLPSPGDLTVLVALGPMRNDSSKQSEQ